MASHPYLMWYNAFSREGPSGMLFFSPPLCYYETSQCTCCLSIKPQQYQEWHDDRLTRNTHYIYHNVCLAILRKKKQDRIGRVTLTSLLDGTTCKFVNPPIFSTGFRNSSSLFCHNVLNPFFPLVICTVYLIIHCSMSMSKWDWKSSCTWQLAQKNKMGVTWTAVFMWLVLQLW